MKDFFELQLNIPRLRKGLHFLGDLRQKSFKIAQWPKGFFLQPAKTGTVTLEQLVAMFFH